MIVSVSVSALNYHTGWQAVVIPSDRPKLVHKNMQYAIKYAVCYKIHTCVLFVFMFIKCSFNLPLCGIVLAFQRTK